MKVSDVVEDLKRRRDVRNDHWFDTGTIIMKTDKIIAQLLTVNQDLRVIEYKIRDTDMHGIRVPWLFIHVEGRKNA